MTDACIVCGHKISGPRCNACGYIVVERPELDEEALTRTLLLDDETLAKYRRFVAMKSNDHYRECPACSAFYGCSNPRVL